MIRSAKDFLSLNQRNYDDGMIRPAKGFSSRIQQRCTLSAFDTPNSEARNDGTWCKRCEVCCLHKKIGITHVESYTEDK